MDRISGDFFNTHYYVLTQRELLILRLHGLPDRYLHSSCSKVGASVPERPCALRPWHTRPRRIVAHLGVWTQGIAQKALDRRLTIDISLIRARDRQVAQTLAACLFPLRLNLNRRRGAPLYQE